MSEISVLLAHAEQAEAEIKRLEEEIQTLQNPQKLLAEGVVSPQLEALQNENSKLKYQINILKRVRCQRIIIEDRLCLTFVFSWYT
uniref:Uncharacterized protein n=1 Tax=Magallana gigas TaxID=29159 RepID=K1PFK8_MAGGI